MIQYGDRVKVIEMPRGLATRDMLGKSATIRKVSPNHYGLEFDEHVHGHDLDGNIRYGYGYFVKYFEVVPYLDVVTGVLTIGDI